MLLWREGVWRDPTVTGWLWFEDAGLLGGSRRIQRLNTDHHENSGGFDPAFPSHGLSGLR
jgi:hypothetical protein